MSTETCAACGGSGRRDGETCVECGGSGVWHRRSAGIRPVPATPAPTRPEMPPGVAAVEQLHRDLAAWKSPAVAPVPEDREEATAIHNYIHAGPWAVCYNCMTAYEFGALHYCAADWQTPRADLPSRFVELVKSRSVAAAFVVWEENERLRVALEFYADRENYKLYRRDLGKRSQIESSLVDQDKGAIARMCLAAAAHGHTEGANGEPTCVHCNQPKDGHRSWWHRGGQRVCSTSKAGSAHVTAFTPKAEP